MNDTRDDYLSERIRDRLIHDSRVNEQDLSVDVRERTITVGGNVSTPHLRESISQVAAELLPDYRIINETKVVPSSEPDGEEPVR
jgi:osmotically-inducible protein OsmY